MDVDTLVFTGSTKIAKQLMVYAGESNMKRVWLEAGGKSEHRLRRRPGPEGRRRSRCRRHRLQPGRSLHRRFAPAGGALHQDKFLPLVIEALKGWKPGNPLDPETNVGALVDTNR